MPTSIHRGEGVSRSKATLFCVECEHESPVDGDWIAQEYGERVDYVCPDCETTITTRGALPDPITGDPALGCPCD